MEVTVTTIPPVPVKPKVDTVTLVLSEKEAQALCIMAGFTTSISLEDALKKSYRISNTPDLICLPIYEVIRIFHSMYYPLEKKGITGLKNG